MCNEFPGFRSASILDEEPYGLSAVATYVGVPNYADPVPDPSWGYTEIDDRILEKFQTDFRYIPSRVFNRSVDGELEVLPDGHVRG